MAKTFEQLITEHVEWADDTFPKGTADGALIHAAREIDEVRQGLQGAVKYPLITKYADVLFCVLDSARRKGITLNQIINVGNHKLKINKARKWKYNGDGYYSHIKP
jgi:Protein of unknown function (DUF550)